MLDYRSQEWNETQTIREWLREHPNATSLLDISNYNGSFEFELNDSRSDIFATSTIGPMPVLPPFEMWQTILIAICLACCSK